MFVIHLHNFFLFLPTHLLHNLAFQLSVEQQGAKIETIVNIIATSIYLEIYKDQANCFSHSGLFSIYS